MAGTLGTIRGQIALDVSSAIAGYVAVRAANAATVYALSRSGATFLAVGKAMTATGLVLAAGLGVAIKAAADFEKQLDFFGAVSNSTAEQMELVRQKALELGQDTRYSAGQIADSFVELGKAGVTAEQIVGGVGLAVANLGAAADIPLERAAQIMTSAVQTFELGAQDAVHVADLLAGAANASIVEIEDLGVSLKYVGGVAASISLPIEDVIDGLALLGKYGIRGSTAGTSLRQILVSLSGTSKKAAGVLKELGIITADGSNKFFDAQGKAKPLADIFQVLQDHTEGLTEAQRLAAFKIIFNNRALSAASVLAREGAAGFAEMNAEIGKTTAADVAAKRMDNLSGDIEVLKGNLETLFIQAGTPFQEFLRGIVQGVTQLVQWFGNLDSSTQQTIFKIIAFTAAGLVVMGSISMMVGVVLNFINTIINLGAAFRLVWGVIKAVTLAFRALGLAMFANPIGLIVLAVIALAAAFVILYKRSETFRNFVNELGARFVEGWNQIVAFFRGLPAFFVGLWNNIRSSFTSGWDAVVTFFTVTIPGWFTSFTSAVTRTVTGWMTAFVGWWAALPGRILGIVQAMINAVVSFFQQLPYRVGFALGFLLGTALRLYAQLIRASISMATQIFNAVVQWFQLLPGRVYIFLSQMVSRGIALFTNFYNSSRARAQAIYNAVVSFFQQLPGRVYIFLSQMVARGAAAFSSFYSQSRARASAIVTAVVGFFQTLPGRVYIHLASMISRAASAFSSMLSNARSFASNVVSTIGNTLANLPGTVMGALNAAISAFRGMVSQAFSAAREFASGLWDGFKAGLGINSPSFIEKQMVQITDVVGQETGHLRSQVRQVQSLGSQLTSIPHMEPTDQTLMTSNAKAMLARAQSQYARIQELNEAFRATSRDIDVANLARTALSVKEAAAKPPPPATTTATGQPAALRVVEGKLSIDDSGQAWISGIAQEVYDGNSQYESTIGRMN